MAKIDKSQLSKSEWKKLKEFRRREKNQNKIKKEQSRSLDERRLKINNQTTPVIPQPITKVDSPLELNNTRKIKKNPTIAFVLGNGTSRESINPEWLRPYGKIYGCNALYRTFDPDYLVAVDVKMVLELHQNGYEKKNHNIWTNPNKSLLKYTGFNFFNPSKGWSSGPTALWLASEHNYDKIYILGFDYRGLANGQKFNNMYADTFNYKKSNDSATFFGNWLRQTTATIQKYSNIEYTRVIAPDNYLPPELNNIENYNTITIDEFQKTFNFCQE